MTSELRMCPNCGAYVMGGDNICPRCDFDLTGPQDLLSTELESVEVTEPDESTEIEGEEDAPAIVPDSIDRKRTTSRLPQVRPMFEIGQRVETGSVSAATPPFLRTRYWKVNRTR